MTTQGKIKNKLRRPTVITIEEMVEEIHYKSGQENKHLYYLINVKDPYGGGIGFRADNALRLWSQLMQEVHL